jgi:DNA-binding transcriptional regulator YiaG
MDTASDEKWAPIAGCGGLYEVSTHGRVKSFVVNAGGRLLNPSTGNHGYPFVVLCSGVRKKNVYVHRLVAAAFIHNPENKPQVNHKSGVKADNSVQNLEWSTSSENNQHAYNVGLNVLRTGVQHNNAKASDKTVALVREIYSEGNYSMRQLTEIFGVSVSTVSRWVNHKRHA